MKKIWVYGILLSATIMMASIETNATPMLYQGAGVGMDSNGVQRTIFGKMTIGGNIRDPLSGYPIFDYYFDVDELFSFSGSNGGIGELTIEHGGEIIPGTNEFYVSGYDRGVFYHSEGPAIFLHEDLSPYTPEDYLRYNLAPYIELSVQFYPPYREDMISFTSTDFILKGESAPPVPEPSTILLMGFGLGCVLLGRKPLSILRDRHA